MLELFSGTGEISKQFRENGFETFEVDWDKKFNSDLHIDIEQLTTEMVVDKFGIPERAVDGVRLHHILPGCHIAP